MAITFEVTPNLEPANYTPPTPIDRVAAIKAITGVTPEASGANLKGTLVGSFVDCYNGPQDMPGFLQAIHSAFAYHFPLMLSPDDVWVTIAQGFALHVNTNAEALRKQFVQHEGKEYIEIQRDNFRKGSPDNDWIGGFDEFSDKIAKFIGTKRDLLVSKFSTTGIIEKAASEVVLMGAMQSYFEYGCRTCCGIPNITLLGTVEDWVSIRTRAQALGEFDCVWWIDNLLPVLDQFVAAAQGKADPHVLAKHLQNGRRQRWPIRYRCCECVLPISSQ